MYTYLFPFVYHFYNYNVFKKWKDRSQERLKKKPVVGPGQCWEVEGWAGVRTKTCWRLAEANPQDESLPWSTSGSRLSRYDLEPGFCLEIFQETGTLRVRRERTKGKTCWKHKNQAMSLGWTFLVYTGAKYYIVFSLLQILFSLKTFPEAEMNIYLTERFLIYLFFSWLWSFHVTVYSRKTIQGSFNLGCANRKTNGPSVCCRCIGCHSFRMPFIHSLMCISNFRWPRVVLSQVWF